MLGKRVLQFLRGETGTPLDQLTNREIQLKSNIKIGYGIMLIGIFCPIFWISFLSGPGETNSCSMPCIRPLYSYSVSGS